MKSRFLKYTPEIILLIYVIAFFLVKNPASRFDRVLISDGKGYYGYLTAIFIYDDLDYQFIEEYEAKYYGHDSIKDFRYDFNGEIVNIYFPGLAFLFLPFFLIAHFLALIFGFPADGYSLIYQYFIGFSALFYLWVGLRFLQRLLKSLSFSSGQIAVVLFAIALGTNINYYTLKEGAMSHVYSFALISAFLFFVREASQKFNLKRILISALLFGLILIIRPTNALVILLVPFIIGSQQNFIKLLQHIFTSWKVLIPTFAFACLFPFLMMLLWYAQSGYWIVYSYGEHGFDFLNPELFRILFGFNKGWFLYTPIAFIAMGGLIFLLFKNRFRFWWAGAFLLSFIYVQSSWFCYTFTSNFSNRTFIDIYPLTAILLGYFLVLINPNRLLRKSFSSLIILLVLLNNIQFYQHYTYIFPPGEITREIYKDSFARLFPVARVWYNENLVKDSAVFTNDFEQDYGWINHGSVTDTLAFRGKYASRAGLHNDYSIGFLSDIKPLMKSDFVWVKISVQVFSNVKFSKAQLVVQLENQNGRHFYQAIYLHRYNRPDKWTYMELSCRLPARVEDQDKLRVYFFNKNRDELFLVDDMKIEVISFTEDPEIK